MEPGPRASFELETAAAMISELKTLGQILNECPAGSRWRDFSGRVWSRRGLIKQWNVHRPCLFVEGQVRPVDIDGTVTGTPGGIIAPRTASAVLVYIPPECPNPLKHPDLCGCRYEPVPKWFILEHRGHRLTVLVVPARVGWELRIAGRQSDGIAYATVQDALRSAERELQRIVG